MFKGRMIRLGIIVCAVICLVATIPIHLWADQSEDSAPSQSGTRTIESGPSLSDMERESASGGWSYNSEYIFGISKAVRDSSMPPGAKVPVYVFSLPLDVVLLPFSALAGLLGE